MLHEAIEKVLRESGSSMTTSQIAGRLNETGWYSKKDGSPITAYQIHGRTKNYPHLFDKQKSLIGLPGSLGSAHDTPLVPSPQSNDSRAGIGHWTECNSFPRPEEIRDIDAPYGPGVYELRNRKTGELVLIGISVTVQERMQSLMPKPYGTGTRNNAAKREYCLAHFTDIEYRTLETSDARAIETQMLRTGNYLFNT